MTKALFFAFVLIVFAPVVYMTPKAQKPTYLKATEVMCGDICKSPKKL